MKKKRRGPKVGFARGDETVDEEVESLHASATKESTATVTTESLSPAAEEDASTPSIKAISNVADSVIKDGVKHGPTTQHSQSVPIADSPADKQSTPSSSFMFDGMSLSAVKMQNPQQKESSLTSAASTAAGTLEAVNKQNAAPLGTKQKEANGAEDGASKLTVKDDVPTSDICQLPSQSTVTPVTPKVAAAVTAVADSASSANKISDINFETEPSSVTQKPLPLSSKKEESEAKESKDPSRSSSSSKEPAPSRQLRAALQPAYEQRGQVRRVCVDCYISLKKPSLISSSYIITHMTHHVPYFIMSHYTLSYPILSQSHHILLCPYHSSPILPLCKTSCPSLIDSRTHLFALRNYARNSNQKCLA